MLQIVRAGLVIVIACAAVTHALECGDCDRDGQIDVLDSLKVAQHAVGLLAIDCLDRRLCDVDAGSIVDVLDALWIAQFAVALPVQLGCRELTWVQRFPSTSPSPRFEHAMDWNAEAGRVVLFGGGWRASSGVGAAWNVPGSDRWRLHGAHDRAPLRSGWSSRAPARVLRDLLARPRRRRLHSPELDRH